MANESGRVDEGKTIKARTIISGFGDHRYIDFTPLEGGKYAPVAYCQTLFNLPTDQTLVAGDSGNDILMFQNQDHGVIVRNHTPEVAEWLKEHGSSLVNKFVSEHKYADAIVDALQRMDKFPTQ
jgi:hydroxymethylpyrimidine pyrophosphatase-like HAD family hydrolase